MDRRLALLPVSRRARGARRRRRGDREDRPEADLGHGVRRRRSRSPTRTRTALRGTATVTAGGQTRRRALRAGCRSGPSPPSRCASAPTGAAALRGRRRPRDDQARAAPRGRQAASAKRTLTRGSRAAAPALTAPAPGGPGAPGPAPAPAPARAGARTRGQRPLGRAGWATEGAYDDLEFTLAGGQLQFTKTPLVPVYCFEIGGMRRTALSFEPFVAAGPWTLGTDGHRRAVGRRRQPARRPAAPARITYKVDEHRRSPGDTVDRQARDVLLRLQVRHLQQHDLRS